jgi:hypothetical protein
LNRGLFLLGLLFLALELFAEEGKVVIDYQSKDATLYIDGKKSINLIKEDSSVMIEEGDHTLKIIEPVSNHSQKYGEKEVYVSASGSVNVSFKFEKELEPTEAYKKILDKKDIIKLQRFHRTKEMVVHDKKLGLMWQDDDYHSRKKRDFTAAKEYCQTLKFSKFADWRLPTYAELQSIVDYDRYDAAIVPMFKNRLSKRYWSSSKDSSSPDYRWSIDFKYGKTSTTIKSKEYYVRCVREK